MAVCRDHCFAERCGPQICNVFFNLDSSHSQLLGSDFVLHPQVCHINVVQSTKSLSVEDVFGGLRIVARPRSFSIDTIPFDSDAPNTAAALVSFFFGIFVVA